jgi:flagellar protein FliL
MATSPTVLADTSTTSSPVSAPAPVPAKVSVAPVLIAVVAGVVIATLVVGGSVYYLARTGRLPIQGGTTQKTAAQLPVVTHAMVLEPFVVNLADAGGNSYLRVALTLQVADVVDKKAANSKDEKSNSDKGADEAGAAVRDTVLTVVGQQTAESLLAANGKEQLKADLKSALAEHNPNLKIADVFLTDFLVQR